MRPTRTSVLPIRERGRNTLANAIIYDGMAAITKTDWQMLDLASRWMTSFESGIPLSQNALG